VTRSGRLLPFARPPRALQAAENETVRLRENTELLYESVRVQKDLLAAKNDEKEECEYQWGVA